MLIIDSHCHFGSGDGLNGPWDTKASVVNYRRWANEYGIEKTVYFAAFNSDYSAANEHVGAFVSRNQHHAYGYAFVHANRDQGRIFKMVMRCIKEYGFKGIKVHRHDAQISREICEVARAFGLPVLYDVMGKISSIELFATEYPDVNFIIPHLGTFSDDWRLQLAFIPMLERHKNVFTDTSGVRRFDLLKMAIDRAGPSKVLYGSDGPWLHPGVELEKVFALTMSEADRELILSKNFLRLTSNIRSQPLTTKINSRHVDELISNTDPWTSPMTSAGWP